MEHYEAKTLVNNEWKTLLVVKSSEAQSFGYQIEFVEGCVTEVYLVNDIFREFMEDDTYVYWFLPTEKRTFINEDTEARELLNALLGGAVSE